MSAWRRTNAARIRRAEKLAAQYSFAAEILRFYVTVARFQENFYAELGKSVENSSTGTKVTSDPEPFARPLRRDLAGWFGKFLSSVEQSGPARFGRRRTSCGAATKLPFQLADGFLEWNRSVAAGPAIFFAHAFLQPYAVVIRLGSPLH